MTESEFNNIMNNRKNYSFSSLDYLDYLDYGDCKDSIILCNNNNMVLLYDSYKDRPIINYLVNDYIKFIDYLSNINGDIRINFVNHNYINELEKIGFVTLCEWMDYFNNDLPKTNINFTDYGKIEYLEINECKLVSTLSKKCKNQSRGFDGETEEWFSEWISENKVIKIKDEKQIIGYCCISIYSEGTTLWIREMAVDPNYQGKGNGKKLIEQALLYGIKNNAKKSFLAVDKLNKNAIGIYKKYGFIGKEEKGELQMIKYE